MTYNFDPDLWYENELAFLKRQRILEKISEREYKVEIKKLEQRYTEMWERLDGSYQIPSVTPRIDESNGK